jgi:hypothetical protein
MTKHKETTDRKVGTGYYKTHDRIGNSYFLSQGLTHPGLYEVTTHKNINYGMGDRFNRCTHTEEMVDNDYIPAGATEVTSTRWEGYRAPGYDIWGLAPQTSNTIALTPAGWESISLDQAQWENARYDGYNRLIHLRPSRHMNALRAAMELKDTKQTMTQLTSFMAWAKKSLGKKVKIGKSGVLRPLSAAMRIADVASAYLWYQFGVAPTVSDIKQFLRQVSEGKLRVKGTKPKIVNQGTVVRAVYGVDAKSSDILSLMYPNSAGSVSVSVWRELPWLGSTRFTTEMIPDGVPDPLACRSVRVAGKLKGMYFAKVKRTFEISGIDQLKDRWSWNCPTFRTLWDLLPFSFLIDWLVDVGGYIEKLEKRYVQTNYTSNLGTIWRWEKRSSYICRPKINSLAMSLTDPETLSTTQWRFKHNVQGSLGYYISEQARTFIREPAGSSVGTASPEWVGSINAYRVSTGMALLAQAAKAWAH